MATLICLPIWPFVSGHFTILNTREKAQTKGNESQPWAACLSHSQNLCQLWKGVWTSSCLQVWFHIWERGFLHRYMGLGRLVMKTKTNCHLRDVLRISGNKGNVVTIVFTDKTKSVALKVDAF